MTITFHDAAAYFSEEEWKLLHEWQRELYENVMKEIHQALISLGPLIATTVVSLKAKEKGDVCAVDNQDSTRWHMVDCSPEGVPASPSRPFLMKTDIHQCLKDHRDLDRGEGNVALCKVTGHQISSADTANKIHNRNESHTCNPTEPARSLDTSEPSTGFSFVKTNICWKKEEQQDCFVDQSGAEEECSMSPHSGQEVVSFIKREQAESYYLDNWDIENCGSTNRFTIGNRIRNRNLKNEDSMDCTEKPSCKVAFRKDIESVVQASGKETSCTIDLEAEKNVQHGSESNAEGQSHVPNTLNANLHQLCFKMENSAVSSEADGYTGKTTFLVCEPNVQPNWSPYAFSEHKNTLGQRGRPSKQCRPHRRHRPYHCAICDRTFMGKSDLVRHQTKHTGEKPYQCEECKKSFTRKGTLVIHQRIHSGERPYHCPECQDCFRDKKQLISHLKYHQE